MYRKLTFVLVILSMLALLVTSAFTTSRVTNVTLLSVSYLREKGVTFKFLMDGNFKKIDLKGSVFTDGRTIRLYCNYGGDPAPVLVVCTADSGTAKFAGQPATVSVAGRSFYFVIPARTTAR
jgi:hypothetical protein